MTLQFSDIHSVSIFLKSVDSYEIPQHYKAKLYAESYDPMAP